jgi:hypothetical protein
VHENKVNSAQINAIPCQIEICIPRDIKGQIKVGYEVEVSTLNLEVSWGKVARKVPSAMCGNLQAMGIGEYYGTNLENKLQWHSIHCELFQ